MALTKANYRMIDGAIANIIDFGADATGSADSSSAIQAAINFGAGAVYFPSGTFKIESPLEIISKNNLKLFGNGKASKITFNINGRGTTSGVSNIFSIDQSTNIHIEHLWLNATGAASETGSAAIQLITSCSYIYIQDNFIDGHNNGLSLGGGSHVWVCNNTVSNCARHAVRQIPASDAVFQNNVFLNSSLELLAFNGAAGSTTQNILFDGNTFQNTGSTYDAWICIDAGSVETYKNISIVNNFFIDNDDDADRGIYWENPNDCDNLVIDGNTFVNFNNGISVASVTNGVLSNNTVRESRNGGIVLSNCQKTSVCGNSTVDCDSVGGGSAGGIHLRLNCSGTLVDGNSCTGGVHGLRIDNASSVGVIVGNNNFTGNSSNYIYDAGTTTNKNGNLFSDTSDAATGATTSEVTLKTKTIAASFLSAGQGFEVSAKGSVTGTNDTKDVKLKFAGVTLATVSYTAGQVGSYSIIAKVVPVSASTSRVDVIAMRQTTVVANSYAQISADITSNQDIVLTGQCANASDQVISRMINIDMFGSRK
jgi:parallel beta-helix repeat protein